MEDFYKEICEVTKVANTDVPKKAIVDISVQNAFNFIMKDMKLYIKIAAMEGYKQAYIGVFNKKFKVYGRIELYKYFEPNEETVDLFKSYELDLLETRILNNIEPFEMELNDYGDIWSLIVKWE